MSDYIQQNAVIVDFKQGESWTILNPVEQSIKRKIEAIGTPLKDWDISINYGIKTGCNEAFIIDGAKRGEILANCATEDERERTAQLIRPILRGRDIRRYGYDWANQYLIATHNGYRNDYRDKVLPICINDYPAIKAHLDEYWDAISVRTDKGITPYNLRNCAYMDDFSKQNIVWADIAREPTFAMINEHVYFNNTCYMITGAPTGLVDILNSILIAWYFPKIATGLGDNGTRYFKQFVENIPVPHAVSSRKYSDKEVFELYGLTDVEVTLISTAAKLGKAPN